MLSLKKGKMKDVKEEIWKGREGKKGGRDEGKKRGARRTKHPTQKYKFVCN